MGHAIHSKRYLRAAAGHLPKCVCILLQDQARNDNNMLREMVSEHVASMGPGSRR